MRPRLILVTSCIIATLCGGAVYPQSKKGNATKTAKSQAAPTTSISAIDGIKKELSLYNLDKAEELIDKLETANRRNKKRIRCLMISRLSRTTLSKYERCLTGWNP